MTEGGGQQGGFPVLKPDRLDIVIGCLTFQYALLSAAADATEQTLLTMVGWRNYRAKKNAIAEEAMAEIQELMRDG